MKVVSIDSTQRQRLQLHRNDRMRVFLQTMPDNERYINAEAWMILKTASGSRIRALVWIFRLEYDTVKIWIMSRFIRQRENEGK